MVADLFKAFTQLIELSVKGRNDRKSSKNASRSSRITNKQSLLIYEETVKQKQ